MLVDIDTIEQRVQKQTTGDKPKPVKAAPRKPADATKKKSMKLDLPKEEVQSRAAPQANIPIQISDAKSNGPSMQQEQAKKVTKSKYNALFT